MKTNRNLWPLGIISAFGLFVTGMAGVVVIASTHREHLVSPNYYEQELQFQARIDAIARAQESGAAITGDPAAGALTIRLPAAQVTQKFSGTVAFYRPSAPELDRELPLEPRADGTQTLDVSRLAAGLWSVRLKWTAGGKEFFLEQKYNFPGK